MSGSISEDTELFIESVEKRPALYLKSMKEYQDIHHKRKLWEEVCSEVVTGWDTLDDADRAQIVSDVVKKWTNLRTCFARELKLQRKITGLAAKKRRKYIHFEKLLFLKSNAGQNAETTVNNMSDEEEEEEEYEVDVIEPTPNRPAKLPITRSVTDTNSLHESILLNLLQEDLDEDKNFALSLVPTLKSLTEDEKFEAKIEILQLFRRIKNKRKTK